MQQQEGSTAETGQRSRPHTARRCEAGADMRHRDAASGEWATGGAKLLAQATAAQLGMLITTTRWTGPTCCWKTVAMAGEWTAAGTATGRAVLMVPVTVLWRCGGGLAAAHGGHGAHGSRATVSGATHSTPSFWSQARQHPFVLVTAPLRFGHDLFYLAPL